MIYGIVVALGAHFGGCPWWSVIPIYLGARIHRNLVALQRDMAPATPVELTQKIELHGLDNRLDFDPTSN